MATRLRKLRVTRVALVAQGANPQADVLLFKAADDLAAFRNEDFRGACKSCGYGHKEKISKGAQCPFCWNDV